MSDRTSFEDAVDAKIQESPEWAALLAQTAGKLRRRGSFYPTWFVDCIFQNDRGGVSLYDADAFLRAWHDAHDGTLQIVRLDVGEGPRPDANREENQGILERLSVPFSATVDQGRVHGEDGILSWSEPFTLSHFPCSECEKEGRRKPRRVVEAGAAGLEIGTQPGYRTWLALAMDFGTVARWPYGSDSVFLLSSPRADEAGEIIGRTVETLK